MDFGAYPSLRLAYLPLGRFEQLAVTQLTHLRATHLAVCPHALATRTPDLILIALAHHYGAAAQVRIGSPVPLTSWWQQRGDAVGIATDVMPTQRRSPFWLPGQAHTFDVVVYDMRAVRDTHGRDTTVAVAIRRLFVAYGRTPFVLLVDAVPDEPIVDDRPASYCGDQYGDAGNVTD